MSTVVQPRGWLVPGTVVTDWQFLPIDGGGYCTGISMEGTERLMRNDTGQAYRWVGGEWVPMWTPDRIPAEYANPGVGPSTGYEVAIAPSDTSQFWMAGFGKLFKSTDYGDTWSYVTANDGFTDAGAGYNYRMCGNRMAVDPVNPDVVFIGALNIGANGGLWYTVNGGTSWSLVPDLPTAATGAGYAVAFDTASTVSGGRTQRIFCAVYGSGVWRSTDAGASWTNIGGPTTHSGITVSSNGSTSVDSTVFVPSETRATTIQRWHSGSWTTAAISNELSRSILIDPLDADHIVAICDSGAVFQSVDNGSTWITSGSPTVTRSAPDSPWLAWANEDYMTAGQARYDPANPTDIWFTQGIGVWTTALTYSAVSRVDVTWVAKSKGIHNMILECATKPSGGPLAIGYWDRQTFLMTEDNVLNNTPAARHYPQRDPAINMTWSLDSAKDGTIVHVTNYGNTWSTPGKGMYQDDGTSWVPFGSFPVTPSGGNGYGYGSIAVDPNNSDRIVWAGIHMNNTWDVQTSSMPYYSNDGGDTWTVCTIPGITSVSGSMHFSYNYYVRRRVVCCDEGGNFYLFCFDNSGAGLGGIYRRAAGGNTWVKVFTNPTSGQPMFNTFYWTAFQAHLQATPGYENHLWFHAGPDDSPESGDAWDLVRSTDGGSTWAAVPNVREPHAIGFGKAKPGNTYPSMYMAGWVNVSSTWTWGIWRSDDVDQATPTWTNIGTYPSGYIDSISVCMGDPDVYGRVYAGGRGSGLQWRQTA